MEVPWTTVGTGASLLAATVGLALLSGRRRARPHWLEALLAVAPLLSSALGAFVLALAFAELAEIELSARAIAFSLIGCGLLAAPLALARGRVRGWLGFALLTAATALATVDLAHLRFFGSLAPIESLLWAPQLGPAWASVEALFGPADAWLLLVPLCGLLVALMPGRDARRSTSGRSRWLLGLLAAAGAALACGQTLHALRSDHSRRVYDQSFTIARIGVFNAHLMAVASSARELLRREPLVPEMLRQVAALHAERARESLPGCGTSLPAGGARGANLLLIQVEALQQWVVGAEVDGQEVMPYLGRLRREALYFPRLFDQTGEGRTSDAEYLVLSSQHPLERGALAFLRQDNHFHTLAHALAAQGYSTLAAHPFDRGFWNRAALHPRYGFQHTLYRRELGELPAEGWGLADGAFFERMLPELERLEPPFFAFLITLGLHHPYETFPAELAELRLEELAGTPLGNYLQGMRHFDRSLQALVEELEARGLRQHTMIGVYGDHVSRLEAPQILRLAGMELPDPAAAVKLRRVPFFVIPPAADRAPFPSGELSAVGGQIDIGPTLLHLLGVERPAAFLGRPLDACSGNDVALQDGSAAATDRLFVASGPDVAAGGECWDLALPRARRRSDCGELARSAAAELHLSRLVLEHDLHRWLLEQGRGDWRALGEPMGR